MKELDKDTEPDNDIFLFDRPWFPKVFKIAREANLDWLRMCAAAEILSDGDPRARNIDWDFIDNKLNQENPKYIMFYVDGRPNSELIDKGTHWGLFQILGEIAIAHGRSPGRLVNLIDIVKNTQVACYLIKYTMNQISKEIQDYESNNKFDKADQLKKRFIQETESRLGWPTELIDTKVGQISSEIIRLLEVGKYL